MMKLFCLCFGLLMAISLYAQKKPAPQKKAASSDIKKMQKDIEKLLQQADPSAISDLQSADAGDIGFRAPKKRTTLLAAIPKKIFTATEYAQYIAALLLKFETSPANKNTVAYVKQHFKYKTGREFHYASIMLWYGKRQPLAVYTALKAVSMDPADPFALNNFAAFLNMSGYPHKAIPILKYGLTKQKDNTTLLNNTGQAYYQLGDLNTASTYLSNCTRIEPYHIEANNTQGHIASANGNTSAASQFYENSLKGGYNQSAAHQLGKLGRKPVDAIRRPSPSSYPETDDNIGFQCLIIPTDVAQNQVFEAKRTAEMQAWSGADDDYRHRVNESMQQVGQNMLQNMQAGRAPAVSAGVMFEKAGLIMAKTHVECIETEKRLADEFSAWKDALNERYAARFEHACEGVSDEEKCCSIMRGIQTSKQMEFAQRYNQYCQQMWANAKGYSNTVAYWMPFFSKQRGILDLELMNARQMLLHTAYALAGAAGTEDPGLCLDEVEPTPVNKPVNFKDPECNFSVKIPLVIGDLEINCQKISISGGEGIVGGAEYNFVTCQSTIKLGIGAGVESGVINADISAQYFITFDGNLTMQDAGITYSAGVSAAEMNAGPLQFQGLSTASSVTVGINSGVTASTEVSAFNTSLFSKETNLYSFSNN